MDRNRRDLVAIEEKHRNITLELKDEIAAVRTKEEENK